jgi:hypothetical protein
MIVSSLAPIVAAEILVNQKAKILVNQKAQILVNQKAQILVNQKEQICQIRRKFAKIQKFALT